jgi:hypothetical protein
MATGWHEYQRRAIAGPVSVEQIAEARRAFYAGAAYFLTVVDDVTKADAFHQELIAFGLAIAEGRA